MPANSCFIFLYCLHLKQVWTKCLSCKSMKTNDSRSSLQSTVPMFFCGRWILTACGLVHWSGPYIVYWLGIYIYIYIPCHSNPQKDRTVSFPGCYFEEVSPIISRFPTLVSFSVIGRVAMWQNQRTTVTPTLAWQKTGWLPSGKLT